MAEADLDERWRGAVNTFDRWMLLSPDRLRALNAEIEAVVSRYETEAEAAADDAEAERVGIIFSSGRHSRAVP